VPIPKVVTFAQGAVRYPNRPDTEDALERYLWLEANFPGLNDRYIGGTPVWKIGRMYGLATVKARTLINWLNEGY